MQQGKGTKPVDLQWVSDTFVGKELPVWAESRSTQGRKRGDRQSDTAAYASTELLRRPRPVDYLTAVGLGESFGISWSPSAWLLLSARLPERRLEPREGGFVVAAAGGVGGEQ